jgi:hypothetical protein
VLEQIKALLESEGFGGRVFLSGAVPSSPPFPYLLVYSLQPVAVRSLARPESARRFRFGVTVCDLSSRFVEADGDKVEALLEGSRVLSPSSRIEWVARGPESRDPEATVDGAEVHTLPIHFTATVPKEPA